MRKSKKVINLLDYVSNTSDLFKSLFIFFNLKFINYIYIFKFIKNFIKFFDKLNLSLDFIIDFYKYDSFNYFYKYNYKNFSLEFENKLFNSLVYNYYKYDVISKNSKNLNLASIEFINSLTILI